MNAVEIEEAVSALGERPFEAAEFPFAFLEAFGNKATTIKRLRSGASNASDVGGVLQRNNIHIKICMQGETAATLTALKESPATTAVMRCSPPWRQPRGTLRGSGQRSKNDAPKCIPGTKGRSAAMSQKPSSTVDGHTSSSKTSREAPCSVRPWRTCTATRNDHGRDETRNGSDAQSRLQRGGRTPSPPSPDGRVCHVRPMNPSLGRHREVHSDNGRSDVRTASRTGAEDESILTMCKCTRREPAPASLCG